MKKMRVVDLAYARSGDKGDVSDIGLIAHDADKYAILTKVITPERVKAYFKDWVKGEVKVYPMPNVNCIEVVLYGALGGGATRTLRIDQTGKAMSQALLRMEVEV